VNTDLAPLPDETVGLYIHVPFCDAKCRYCGFYSERLGDQAPGPLVSTLITELARYRAVPAVDTVYIGGGSPTCLPRELLGRITEAVRSQWPAPAEFTVECNPGQTDEQTLSMLRQYGVNRLSFGVQSFHPEELVMLGRRHSVEQATGAVRMAQDLGFDNVGLDLIFAIPGSTLASWRHCLRAAVKLGVQHISAYSLSFEPGTPFEEARRTGLLQTVDEDTDRAMYDLAIDFLASAGFAQYEISNFAQPGCTCRHNQGYWRNHPYIGIGPSAGAYWRGKRTTNLADIDQYIQRVEAGLDAWEQYEEPGPDERACETAVLNLRTREGVDVTAFRHATGTDFQEVFATPLRRYEYHGWIEINDNRVRLTRKALAVADSILCDFSSL